MANSIAFSLRRMLAAVTLFSLPFFLFSEEFLILKIVVASYFACLSLFANRSQIIPILKLFSCSSLGAFVAFSLGGYWRRPINADALDLSLLGLAAGLALGLTWVQYQRDSERFEAYVDEPDAFEKKIDEPSILRATLPVFFLILVFWAAYNFMFSLAHVFSR